MKSLILWTAIKSHKDSMDHNMCMLWRGDWENQAANTLNIGLLHLEMLLWVFLQKKYSFVFYI